MSHILSVQELCAEGGWAGEPALPPPHLCPPCPPVCQVLCCSGGPVMVRISQGLGHQHLGLKPRTLNTSGNQMLSLFLGYFGCDNCFRKAGGQGRGSWPAQHCVPVLGGQTESHVGLEPPQQCSYLLEAPLCPPFVEWLRTQRNGFLWQERRNTSPCFDLIS